MVKNAATGLLDASGAMSTRFALRALRRVLGIALGYCARLPAIAERDLLEAFIVRAVREVDLYEVALERRGRP